MVYVDSFILLVVGSYCFIDLVYFECLGDFCCVLVMFVVLFCDILMMLYLEVSDLFKCLVVCDVGDCDVLCDLYVCKVYV